MADQLLDSDFSAIGTTEIVLKQMGGYRHCPETFHHFCCLFKFLPCVVREVLWLG
jgi:hypothetical protein